MNAFEQTILHRDPARGTIHVPHTAVVPWVACLNDIRLLIAAELDLRQDWASMEASSFHGQAAQDWMLFLCLTVLQEQIVCREMGGR